jgi:hypothetical protein
MTIRLDKTQFSVVVLCSHCPSWRALRNDKDAGLAAGRQHNLVEHAGQDNTLTAARQQAYRARKAAAGV